MVLACFRNFIDSQKIVLGKVYYFMDVSKISLHRSKLMALCIFSIMICHNTLQLSGTMQSINDAARTFMQGG